MNKQELVKQIVELKGQGLGSRKIAKELGIGKSTVNQWFKDYLQGKGTVDKKPKIALIDIETAPSITTTFGRFKQNISQDAVLREGGWIISYSYKWLGEPEIYGNSVTPEESLNADDSGLCMELFELIEEADVLVGHNCVHKDTPVLKKDLTWVPASSLKIGDEIFSFDEGRDPYVPCRTNKKWNKLENRNGRKINITKVTSNFIEKKDCVRVILSNGDSVITTKDHYWLGCSKKDNNMRWYKSEKLLGKRVKKYFDVWSIDTSYEAGWLSGFFEGEGSLTKSSGGFPSSMQICQRPGPTWEKFKDFSKKKNLSFSDEIEKMGGIGKGDCLYAYLRGGRSELLKVLGSMNVTRLKNNIDYENIGYLRSDFSYEVVAVEDVGVQEVAVLSTEDKTFFASGYAMHNCNNFDIPIIKSRMIVNGLPPIKKVKSIDTLTLAREFRFNSNKLDSLCRQLDIGEKVKHSGISLWVDCMEGKQEALDEMLIYNKKDVDILEELYLHIRPYSNRHPNLAVNLGDKLRCNICCSDKVKPTGNTVSTNLSVFTEYVCEECQARFKDRQSTTTKSQRLNFLSN